ncbi:MAG: hypothetical protein EXX96DRAFT_604330 [Benjaminiella poitrasii]|nr:MAG: hypothetical protein EXX96DRAFT_604330 [Benjaminiella poitrasii]
MAISASVKKGNAIQHKATLQRYNYKSTLPIHNDNLIVIAVVSCSSFAPRRAFVAPAAPASRQVLGDLPIYVLGDSSMDTSMATVSHLVDGVVAPSPAAFMVDSDELIDEDEEMSFVGDESAMDVDDEMPEVVFRFSFLDVAYPSVWMEGVVQYPL